MEEIRFISDERLQGKVVQALLQVIALRMMEECTDAYAIAQAYGQLASVFPQKTTVVAFDYLRPLNNILPQETIFIDFTFAKPFVHFFNASQEMNRYLSPVSLNVRQKALDNVETHLRKLLVIGHSKGIKHKEPLQEIANTWLVVVQQERERFMKMAQGTGHLFNPYC